MSEAVALGFRAHSGWATAVAVGGSLLKPFVLERRRIETADNRIAGSKQPYHAAQELSGEVAETFIRDCRDSSTLLAIQAIRGLATQIGQNGSRVLGTAILLGSAPPLPPLTAILRSHALIHAAEGEFFRHVLVVASEQCSLQVTKVKERDIWEIAESVFGSPITDLQRRIGQLGNSVGRPWAQDQKLASLAAWIALFGLK